MSRTRFIALLLAFVTLLVYLPVGRHQFVNYDDMDYVVQNTFVKSGLSLTNIRWAFTSFHAGNWHPLTWISHQLDCELFGLHAGAQHLVNVLFHAANTVLLLILLLRLAGAGSFWPCVTIAALFAWHPLHVESVAWIAERKDLLSTFFGLLALICYVRYARENVSDKNTRSGLALPAFHAGRVNRDYFLTLLFFTLSLLSKAMLVTLPFLLLLLDFWPLARGKILPAGRLVMEKIPFFLLTFASCIVTFFAQKNGETVASLIRVPLSYRLENAPVSMLRYVGNLFWPAGLNVIYPLSRIYLWQGIVSGASLILILALAWRWRKTRPYFLFGWLWFLGTLVPVVGLIQVGSQSIADRYTYIPSIGFFIAVVFLATELAAKIQIPKIIIAGITGIVLSACIGLTEFQLRFWQDSETLFRRAIAVAPDNVIALVDLGVALDSQARFDEAVVVYRRAEKFATGPYYYQLHNNLGNILALLGRPAESLAEYKIAITERPNDPRLHTGAATAFVALGNRAAALQEFTIAEQLAPNDVGSHIKTANILLQLGRDPEALNELRTA
ncbi:MAG TPA: tetratricopeptide repeat protein, partial [Verrucomicrobiae bacterium]